MFSNYECLDSIIPILLNKACKNFCKEFDSILKPYGLSKLHAFYLIVLFNNANKGITLSDINNKLGCDKANTSRALTNLMEKNFISKSSNACEKKYMVKLTKEGEQLAKTFIDRVQESNYELLSVFDEEEKMEFFRLVKKLGEGVSDDTNKKYS